MWLHYIWLGDRSLRADRTNRFIRFALKMRQLMHLYDCIMGMLRVRYRVGFNEYKYIEIATRSYVRAAK